MSDHDTPVDDAALAAEEAKLRELLDASGVPLDGEELWLDPSADLEDRIMAGLRIADPVPLRRPSRVNRWLAGAAAVAAAVLAFVTLTTVGGDDPDWVVALGPTDAFPAASADVLGWNEASGTRMELEISGLPKAPEGFVYELWLSDGPIHISAGTFHSPDDVTLWAGVSRGDFPRVWITLEPIDDDPSPARNVLDTGPTE